MAKTTLQFLCSSCGGVQPKWAGKCPDCGGWGTLEEFRESKAAKSDPHRSVVPMEQAPQPKPIGEVGAEAAPGRLPTGIGELDRVLGGGAEAPAAKRNGAAPAPTGGFVPGSVVLIGGDPGIGKSTLLLQAAGRMAGAEGGARTILYVSAEESAHQLRLRAERLGAIHPTLLVLADTNLSRILEQARRVKPDLVVLDSVQMVYKGDLAAAPGSLQQLRACCLDLVYFAKATGTAVVLVGHVTKEGALAGPKLLEHMVDAVLYFEGDRHHAHRVVRAIKNRFGTTLEVGLFEMGDAGLREVTDGAGLSGALWKPRAGSVVCPVLQGSRCLLLEMQALTASGFLGAAKRKVAGLDAARLAMLIAVLEKHAGLHLADQDVFASAVGGVKVTEPAGDLPLALAIAGAHLRRSLPEATCAFGELGLGGELRPVQQMERRVVEAARLGFKRVLAPPGSKAFARKGVAVEEVANLEAALRAAE